MRIKFQSCLQRQKQEDSRHFEVKISNNFERRPASQTHSMKMSETNGNGTMVENLAEGKIEPVLKKARVDDSVEERDFDEETQKALEEIDANQNEIDALNERESHKIWPL